ANFYLRRQAGAKAEPYLKKIIDALPGTPVEAIAGARRDFAFILARRGAEGDFSKGLELIKKNLELYKNDRADQRALAALYATRPQYRNEAKRLYEDLERQGLEPQEMFTLARLYDDDDNWSRAEMVLLKVLHGSERGNDPAHIRYYALRLLSRGQ